MLRQMTFDPVLQTALRLADSGQTEDALRALDGALRQGPSDTRSADYHWLRGCILQDRGAALTAIGEKRDTYKSASAAYQRAAFLDPSMFLVPGILRPETTWAVPAYIQLLKHEGERAWTDSLPGHLSKTTIVRQMAARMLGRIGRSAREALEPLEAAQAQEETRPGLNAAAAMKQAIQSIKRSDRGIEERRSRARLYDEVWQRLSEHEFRGAGGQPENVYTGDLDAVWCLSQAELLQMVTSPDVEKRARAIAVLGARGEGSLEACRAIAPGLTHKKAVIRSLSVYALGQLAPNSKTASAPALDLVPTLLRLLTADRSLQVRKAAALALGAVGTDSTEALNGLMQAIKKGYDPSDRYGKVAVAAIEAIGGYGEAAAGIVPYLREYQPAGHQADEARVMIHEALLRLAPTNREVMHDVLPKLVAAVGTRFESVTARGAPTRDAIGHSHCQPNPEVRRRAIKALGTVQPAREQRVLALVNSLWMDESAENRQLAGEFLQRLDHELAVEAGVMECLGLSQTGGAA